MDEKANAVTKHGISGPSRSDSNLNRDLLCREHPPDAFLSLTPVMAARNGALYFYPVKRTASILLILLYMTTCLGFYMAVRIGIGRVASTEKMVKDRELVAMKGIVKI